MAALVSMIRGINVAGSRPLKMDRLRALLEGIGLRSVRTYLQSGNAVFDSGKAAADVGPAIEREILRACAYEVTVVVKTGREMAAARMGNPLAGGKGVDPRFLHATFLSGHSPKPSLAGAELPLARGEAAVLAGGIVYLYCPNGYGNTRLNNNFFERRLGCRATTRNWNTVCALDDMASARPA